MSGHRVSTGGFFTALPGEFVTDTPAAESEPAPVPPPTPHDDRGLEFLDSPTREQLLHQITGTTTTGASPVPHPSEGQDQ